ncbi:MAG TPA: M20 family metallopeptidase [Terriglobales bacterium]|nr:M20 family metallopeptidase [Terriglobales bacterium]
MLDAKTIAAAVSELGPELIAMRRKFHLRPELGGAEKETSAFCKAEAEKLGLSVEMLTDCAFAATLDTGRPGRTIYMRADMDALPMKEDPLNGGGIPKPCVSQTPGVAHTCGHDAHTAILVGVMKCLAAHKDKLMGKVVFLFESGEENFGSGREIEAYLKKKGGDLIWGLHVAPDLPVGVMNCGAGVRTSGAGKIEVTFHGRGGHSSRPDRSVNPHVAASAAILALQTVVPLGVDPNHFATLAVCSWNGGTMPNVIPDDAVVTGGFRVYDAADGEKIAQKVKAIANDIAAAHGCTAEVAAELLIVPIKNDAELAKMAVAAMGKQRIAHVDIPPIGPSETFGYYSEVLPAAFALVGCGNKEAGVTAGNHMERFDIDEAALMLGCRVSLQFVCDAMTEGGM